MKMKRSKIFILWYQGEKNAPDLVKLCISSIKNNSADHDVIVLDNHNLYEWIPKFPKEIERKFDNGIFSMQLKSDLIRYSLLEKYNCLWLDATVFVSHPIPQSIFSKDFFTVVRTEAQKKDISGKISPFIMGRNDSPQSRKIFSFCKNMLETYILKEDDLINYLLVENILYIAIKNNNWLKKEIDTFFNNKKDVLGLVKKLNTKYDKNIDVFLKNNTFNKLNFHKNYSEKDVNGNLTVFGKLKEQYLKEEI